MKIPTACRLPTLRKNLLSLVMAITFMVTWLPFIRSLSDGTSYQWGMDYFGAFFNGQGLEGDFLFLVLSMAGYGALFFSMYWTRARAMFYGLLGIWYMHIFGSVLFDIYTNGDTVFQGETMDVNISITWIVIPLAVLAMALVIGVIREDLRDPGTQVAWSGINTTLAWLLLALLPVQVVLLAIGEPHGMTDKIGVIISIAECYMLPFLYRSYLPATTSTQVLASHG